MDNYHFDITGAELIDALAIAFAHVPGNKAEAWAELDVDPKNKGAESVWGASAGKKRLVLFWNFTKDNIRFPSKIDVFGVEPIVANWLKNVEYGPEPDHDGSNKKGCRVYNEEWGHVANQPYAFCAIEPVWLMYGK